MNPFVCTKERCVLRFPESEGSLKRKGVQEERVQRRNGSLLKRSFVRTSNSVTLDLPYPLGEETGVPTSIGEGITGSEESSCPLCK